MRSVLFRQAAVLTLALCPPPALLAQQAATPGDSIRVQFSPTDSWHMGTITDRFRDTLVVSGCAGCLRDPFVISPEIRVEALRERDAATAHSAVIGFILGAVGGALVGTLSEQGCSSFDSNRSGSKCSGLSGPTLGLAGGVIGAIVGAVAGHRRGYKRWEKVVRTLAPASPRMLVRTQPPLWGCCVSGAAQLVQASVGGYGNATRATSPYPPTDRLGHPSI